jgi:hypothetical protein
MDTVVGGTSPPEDRIDAIAKELTMMEELGGEQGNY